MARQYLAIVQETTYKTLPTASFTAPINAIAIRLDGGNAFTMRPVPQMVSIPYGGGIPINAYKASDKTALAGRLSVILCESQAEFLFGWATTLINPGPTPTARTLPWVTTSDPMVGDLASCTILHAIEHLDPSVSPAYQLRSYTGCKVAGWDLEVSEDSQIARLNLDIVGSTPNPTGTPATFPEPAATNLPHDFYYFASGLATVLSPPLDPFTLGTVRTRFNNLRVTSRNVLAQRYFANKYLSMARWLGTNTTVDTTLVFESDTDRYDFENLTDSLNCIFVLNGASKKITIDMKSVNILTSVADDLPNDNLYTQALTVENMFQGDSGGYFSVTVS